MTDIEPFIKELVNKNGPETEDYSALDEALNAISEDKIEPIRSILSPTLNKNTLHGFGFSKPFGYSGDFFMIEKIYQHWINHDKKYKKWDLFFHQHPAPNAVRNRKHFFVDRLEEVYKLRGEKSTNILILGSGPATDVAEFFERNPSANFRFDLLDLDPRAIDYAKIKNVKFLQRLNFLKGNVLRLKPEKNYDLVWSAGLFDYFGNRHFSFLIAKYFPFVKENSEMIIGNFSPDNPSKQYMEIMGDWFLNYRDENELMEIVKNSNIKYSEAIVSTEPLGINLFVRLKK